jgi:hypothetical protein
MKKPASPWHDYAITQSIDTVYKLLKIAALRGRPPAPPYLQTGDGKTLLGKKIATCSC